MLGLSAAACSEAGPGDDEAPRRPPAAALLDSGAIEPNLFVAEMDWHWTRRLDNVTSPALRRVWKQLASTFATHIEHHGRHSQSTEWTVLQPPTGSGKSEGTMTYCAMLSAFPDKRHPGVLIVTRLIDDANRLAERINRYGQRPTAVAYHSEARKDGLDIATLTDWPVVVITHRAYELALDHLGKAGCIEGTWELFHSWGSPFAEQGDGSRRLIVIDEALDIVEHSKAGLDGLRQTLGAIPQPIRRRFPGEVKAIELVVDLLELLDDKSLGATVPESMVTTRLRDATLMVDGPPDFTELRQAMRGVKFDMQNHREDIQERARLREMHDSRLRSLHHIFRSWFYCSRSQAQCSFNTARLLVPEGVKGAVVLDATADSNVLYEVFDDTTVVMAPPGARDYSNVTLHVSRGHKVGKRHMFNKGKPLTQELVSTLNEQLEGRKVFVVTHKAVEPFLKSYDTSFEMMPGHWKAVDGSNEWRDCDAAVIFGLPYLPDSWSPNVFMACQGPQSTQWLRADGERPYSRHADIRRALRVGAMTVSLVQAINRVRCRKVIDVDGNCESTDVYILLPDQRLSDELLDGIKREMPGIKVVNWQYGGAKRTARRSKHGEALKAYLENMRPGRQSAGTVTQVLGISRATFRRLINRSDVGLAMGEAGVVYEVQRTGRGARSWFKRA